MDYQHILSLIAAISGNPSDDFAALKTGGGDPETPVAQTACPRPFPVNEIEGKTMFCGTLQVPGDHNKPEGKEIPLKFTIMKSWHYHLAYSRLGKGPEVNGRNAQHG